ncbi:TIGR03668 family PPOX class F420-dependent oxidoreductase [Dactylosporangium roseum]|uniref:TIGR03668 family PPOX class F420-dependent oxidoreductase n=1 Tax=Dactylosporangium roseum TaxID=47989 RepID=A0ABY5YUX0_9ACTN|nr:TIGR03668 family PPOX class F420-dependent oxidoreductase [Dactylosporangium roseum]UWZ33530.1 TIGR03668 family PPOX class F420-dependent oxidoreductase [Dactylosporangium roseum]
MKDVRERFAAAPVARLATVGPDEQPHLVPIVFVLVEDTIYHGVDAKPKRGTELRRLANLAANPKASVLVDHYADDWSELWWVRADGVARDVDPDGAEGRRAVALLSERYPRFRLTGRLIAIDVVNWANWSAR